MSVPVINKELVRQRIANTVASLMEEQELYREDLAVDEIVGVIVEIVEENNLWETFLTITDEDLKKRCNGIMAMHSWVNSFKQMSPEELDELIDMIEVR
jgi:hypothetical protein